MTDRVELQQKIKHTFVEPSLLQQALTHRSMCAVHNERLEFLGDALLGMVMAAELYQRYPQYDEGQLSRLRSSLVNGQTLAQLAGELMLSEHLLLGAGEKKSGGHHRASILAGAMEAIMGAIYLDAGLELCRSCVLSWYGSRLDNLEEEDVPKDAKSQLQEWLQARKKPLPDYAMTVTGEAHAQTFHITCTVVGMKLQAKGVDSSRRKAEQQAAQQFLDLIDE